MNYKDIPPMTPERWINNLLDAAGAIADKEHQERRWLAPDRYAWECPDELINVIFDDSVFEGFLGQYAGTFSEDQRGAAFGLRDTLNAFCDATPPTLDSAATLADPWWKLVRQRAAEFVCAFKGKWPVD